MADLNTSVTKVTALKEKIKKDVSTLISLYSDLKKEIDHKFKEELKLQKGDYNGLEDFYALVMMLKKDTQTSVGVLSLLKRLNDLSGFSISEIEDKIEDTKKLEDLFE